MRKTIQAITLGTLLMAHGPRTEAQEPPAVIGTVKNRAGGEIVFSTRSTSGCRAKDAIFAYVRDDGGKISLTGCWRIDGELLFVFWDDGDTYSYPLDAIQFSEEWMRYSESKDRGRGEPTT